MSRIWQDTNWYLETAKAPLQIEPEFYHYKLGNLRLKGIWWRSFEEYPSSPYDIQVLYSKTNEANENLLLD